jgi:phage-related protein
MKPLIWMGDSRKAVKAFAAPARHEAGVELMAVQAGENPSDWKPMTSIGVGVKEIRIRAGNAYRVIYLAKFSEAVYVLHAFVKKTPKTAKHDLDLAGERYREALAARRTT